MRNQGWAIELKSGSQPNNSDARRLLYRAASNLDKEGRDMALQELLGACVIDSNKKSVEVTKFTGEGKVLGLYFSAHWCPPCRAFTPQLATWYNNFKASPNGEKFEIVFVSSDRGDEDFKSYFSEMPWLALAYSERAKKDELSTKFKVSGIPTLVMLDACTGKLITADGRSIVMEDEMGKEFPWMPKPFLEVIQGNFIGPNKEVVTFDAFKGKVLGIYFSAHWCGPCRSFTPQLIKVYNKLKGENRNFEIIFVSSDKDSDSWEEYFSTMPWFAIPFNDSRKKLLSRWYDISGIPSLIIIDEAGKTITAKGRGAVGSDPEGKDFPWSPKPANMLNSNTASDINELPSLIWFTGADRAATKAAFEMLTVIAEEHMKDWKASGIDNRMVFYVGGDSEEDEDDIISSLRSFAGLGSSSPLLAIVSIPDQKVFQSDDTSIDDPTVRKFITDFLGSKLTGKSLRC